VAFNKRALRREIERDRKRAVRARLAELRALIKAARERRKAQLVLIRDQCRAERKALSLTCSTRRAQARQEAREAVAARRTEIGGVLSEERVYQRVDALERKPGVRKASARERRQESDDEVRSNLPPELVPVFNAVRRFIKGSPRKSRTEDFLQWAEENAGEVYAIQGEQADREVRRLVAEYEALNKPRRGRRSLADVPF
jgi:hypothetical protein